MLLVIDIARLRDINGLYGFAFGDELLRSSPAVLAASRGPRRWWRGWAATGSRARRRLAARRRGDGRTTHPGDPGAPFPSFRVRA